MTDFLLSVYESSLPEFEQEYLLSVATEASDYYHNGNPDMDKANREYRKLQFENEEKYIKQKRKCEDFSSRADTVANVGAVASTIGTTGAYISSIGSAQVDADIRAKQRQLSVCTNPVQRTKLKKELDALFKKKRKWRVAGGIAKGTAVAGLAGMSAGIIGGGIADDRKYRARREFDRAKEDVERAKRKTAAGL